MKSSHAILRWGFSSWLAVGIAGILITPVLYLFSNGFGEQGEVTFSTVSWLLANGNPLYVGPDSAERYSLQHGPIVYFVVGYIMKAFGPSYLTAKVATVGALMLSIAFSWLLFRKRLSRVDSVCLLGLEAWLFMHWPYTYLIRPDALMLLCVTAGLYFVEALQKRSQLIIVIALLLGLMINLKIHGFIYFLPILYLVYRSFGARTVAVIGGLSILLAVVPFLSPYVSLTNYLFWLSGSINHGIMVGRIVAKILLVAAIVILPVAVGKLCGINLRSFYLSHRPLLLVVFVATVLPSIIGSKVGSGTNHLIPLIPTFMYLYMLFIGYVRQKQASWQPSAVSPGARYLSVALITLIVVIVTIGGINPQKRMVEKIKASGGETIIQDLRRLEADYAGCTLAIGYGEKDSMLYSNITPLPVFHGSPYLIDMVALGDMAGSGVTIPAATAQKLNDGAIRVWLIPRGEKPFAYYLFNGSFRDNFLNHYQMAGKTKYFDVWVYRSMDRAKLNSNQAF
ncbi:ArnT family glycosyltransferase [Anaeroselena agilis]|uniref:Glycosyltransferase family 39 protein n=1 Tax=Anaeroselena agilis TaxID=3063788 RepID=A0ABU3NXU0_9FIRM|nr:glycosyltransferase family 39 protein [Selenomonadales bacterium 4137-cl]